MTPSSADIDALKTAFDALNRNDMASFMTLFDPQIERVEPEGFPSSGTYRGIDAIRAHFTQARETWAEGTCTPLQFVAAGDRVAVQVRVHVRLKGGSDWIDAVVGDGFTFRDGKVIYWRTFAEWPAALAWASAS